MLKLRFTTFDGVVHTHELKVGTTRIGRTTHNDLQIDELALSSQHAEIHYDGQSIVVRDLDSVAGTYVEGQPVTEAVVKVGQVVSLGSFLIRLEDSPGEPAAHSQHDLQTVRLQDGSYSCFRHATRRALYECEGCFDLACDMRDAFDGTAWTERKWPAARAAVPPAELLIGAGWSGRPQMS